MKRDPQAKKKGYSNKGYIEALNKGLLPHYLHSQLFIQYNSGIHSSRAVRAFLLRHHVNTIVWATYSPDLNPIKHLWWHLKKRMFKYYPQYNNYSTATEECEGFLEALKECWKSTPRKLIKSLIMSMPHRFRACRRARGWQTKY
jgi:transposase